MGRTPPVRCFASPSRPGRQEAPPARLLAARMRSPRVAVIGLVVLVLLQPTSSLRSALPLAKLRTAAAPTALHTLPVSPRSCAAAACRRHAAVLLSEDATEAEAAPAASVSVKERLRLFWRLAVPYFQQADGAKLNFGLMLLLVLVNSSISVIFSYVGRDFYSALSAKDQVLFFEKTANYAVGLAVATPLTVLYKFQRQRLALNWRQWMTTELARQYYTDQAYYKIEIDPEIDNPDQRITEDVTAFTKASSPDSPAPVTLDTSRHPDPHPHPRPNPRPHPRPRPRPKPQASPPPSPAHFSLDFPCISPISPQVSLDFFITP